MAAAMIAKAILGGIGGGLSGAANGAQSGNMNISEDIKKAGESINKMKQQKGTSEDETEKTENKPVENTETEKKPVMPSDEELKDIYGDSMTDSLLENFSKIAAIDFTYKPEAQAEYNGNANVDGKEHIGVKAQELESNPVTSATVETDEHGNKVVNTDQLAMADTAVIAEMSRRILTLEVAVKELLAKTRG